MTAPWPGDLVFEIECRPAPAASEGPRHPVVIHRDWTGMADAGIPLHVLQCVLGHKSIETTRGYLHPDTRQLVSAAEQANASFDAQQQRQAPSPTSAATRPSPHR